MANKKTPLLTDALHAVVFSLALPFIGLVAILPFPVAYFVSDGLYLLLYKTLGYRKVVVTANLQRSFPGMTEEELALIRSKFYHHLCDLFVETLKLLAMSKKTIMRRCSFTPQAQALFDTMAAENRSLILAMGHNGNWEWSCNACSLLIKHRLFVIYHPLGNRYFDRLMHFMRTRGGATLVAMQNTYREMAANKAGLNATAFVADQTPLPDNAYWTTFLQQDTPVFKGMEVIARKMGQTVLYTAVRKVSRGYYEMDARVLSEDAAAEAPGQLTRQFMNQLQQDIVARPEDWLWSHRRWKHKKPATAASI